MKVTDNQHVILIHPGSLISCFIVTVELGYVEFIGVEKYRHIRPSIRYKHCSMYLLFY